MIKMLFWLLLERLFILRMDGVYGTFMYCYAVDVEVRGMKMLFVQSEASSSALLLKLQESVLIFGSLR